MRHSIVAFVMAALVATACADGGPSKTSAPPQPDHNEPDIAFISAMIPHHAQAVLMSDMAVNQGAMVEVKDLASRIKATQQQEIEKMKGWLSSWPSPGGARNESGREGGAVEPEASRTPDQGAHGGAGGRHAGMLSASQLEELRAMSGEQFDRRFLTSMIFHHEGAVTSAHQVLDQGLHAGVKELAGKIIETQQAELAEIRTLLDRLGAAPPTAGPVAVAGSPAPAQSAPGQPPPRQPVRQPGQPPAKAAPSSQPANQSPANQSPANQSPPAQPPASQSITTQPPANQSPSAEPPATTTTRPPTTTTTQPSTTSTTPCSEEHRQQGHC